MKKLLLLSIIILLIASCNNDEIKTDTLTNSIWTNESIRLEFSTDGNIVCNDGYVWNGVYILYPNNSILIYKYVAGQNDMLLVYTGNLYSDKLELTDSLNKLNVLKKVK